jgi:hypothetical protein
VVCHTDVEGIRSVMPAKAGIQGDSALASGYTSWIPGLALLARNDVLAVYPSSLLWWSTSKVLCLYLIFGGYYGRSYRNRRIFRLPVTLVLSCSRALAENQRTLW